MPAMTLLQQANEALRTQQYDTALDLYSRMLRKSTVPTAVVHSNLSLLERRLRASQDPADRSRLGQLQAMLAGAPVNPTMNQAVVSIADQNDPIVEAAHWAERLEGHLRSSRDSKNRTLDVNSLVQASRALFQVDQFPLAHQALRQALAKEPGHADAKHEQKNQYCYHAYSSWLMETMAGEAEWYKADGLSERPDWNAAFDLCKGFVKEGAENPSRDLRQFVQAGLLLAEECRDRNDHQRADEVVRESMRHLGTGWVEEYISPVVQAIRRVRTEGGEILDAETENIQQLLARIPVDTLSVQGWLSLNDILNWNGLLRCGLVAREHALVQARRQGETYPKQADRQLVATRAALEQGDFAAAQGYIARYRASNGNARTADEMVAYCCLLQADVEGFRRHFGYPVTEHDRRFQEYIRGKSVAIVGPAPSDKAHGKEIDSFDVVIRFNYRGLGSQPDPEKYGTKTNVSLYNAHGFRHLVVTKAFSLLEELDFCLIRRTRYDLNMLPIDRSKIRQIHEPNQVFYKSMNAVPALVYDLLLQGASLIKIFNSNFYVSKQHHTEQYSYRKEDSVDGKPLRNIQPILFNHCLVTQITFAKNISKNYFIIFDERCSSIINKTNSQYLSVIERKWNFKSANKEIYNGIKRRSYRYVRLIFVLSASPHKLLTALSVLNYQKSNNEYSDCLDYLVIAGGTDKGVESLLDAAKSWGFSKCISIDDEYNKLRDKNLSLKYDKASAQDLIRKKIKLKNVDVVYHWSPTDDILWGLYPSARKICFGDALGILKIHSFTRRFQPTDEVLADDAYLIAPFEETPGCASKLRIKIVEPIFYRNAVISFAEQNNGVRDYCAQIRRKHKNLILLPTSYFSNSGQANYKDELDIFVQYALDFSDKDDTIVIKSHPSTNAKKQASDICILLKPKRNVIQVTEDFENIPIEIFSYLLQPKTVLAGLSTCAISVSLVCSSNVIVGYADAALRLIKNNLTVNADHALKQKILYVQAKCAMEGCFPLFTLSDALDMHFELPRLIKNHNSKKSISDSNYSVKNYNYNDIVDEHLSWKFERLGDMQASLDNQETALTLYNVAKTLNRNHLSTYIKLSNTKKQIYGLSNDVLLSYYDAIKKNVSSTLYGYERHRNRLRAPTHPSRGVVFLSSLEQPPLGMNKSIQLAFKYFSEFNIKIDFQLSDLNNVLHFCSNYIQNYDFILFNSTAGLASWNGYKFHDFVNLLAIPVFIYWHETEWGLDHWTKQFSKAHKVIQKVSPNANVVHLTASKAGTRAVKSFYPEAVNIFEVYECSQVIESAAEFDTHDLGDDFFIINIASIQERKGTDLFVDTAIKVCKNCSGVKFLWVGKVVNVAGSQELFDGCVNKIKANNLEDRIIFAGHRADVFSYIKKSHLFFLSSRDDPFPLGVIEAMACGKNIVTFDVGGAPEAIGSHGTTIPSFDTDIAAYQIMNIIDKKGKTENMFLKELYQQNYTPYMFAKRLSEVMRVVSRTRKIHFYAGDAVG